MQHLFCVQLPTAGHTNVNLSQTGFSNPFKPTCSLETLLLLLIHLTLWNDQSLTMSTHKKGDRIDVTRGGSHKKCGKAICLEAGRKTQAAVEVIGDGKESRNLWLTSIGPCKEPSSQQQDNTTEDEICLSKQEHTSPSEEIAALTMQPQRLEMNSKVELNHQQGCHHCCWLLIFVLWVFSSQVSPSI